MGKLFRGVTSDDCERCPARHIDLLAGTDRTEQELLRRSFDIATFEHKEMLYRSGDAGDWLYLVRFGLVKLIRYSTSGAERIVRLARAGDTIGLSSLARTPYRRTAIAMTRTEVCRVATEFVRRYNLTHPESMEDLLGKFQAELEGADTFLVELSTGSAHVRMARLLLFLVERQEHTEAPLPNREEMGALLGITAETASRVTAEFRREGVISGIHMDRCACDVEALRRIATG
jgi:CRP/FNR family transcriptional regulator, anaerobic regulatory protein